MDRARVCVLGMFVIAAHGCGSNLGECDNAAANELVYSSNQLVATKGQALIHDSCGNGAFCHSAAASGSARYGVPAGMNFDMLPVPSGWPALMERRDTAWDLVESGAMPPGDAGEKVLGDNGWVFDPNRSDQAPKLPKIATNEGKALVRNWLACGGPVVSQTKIPTWAQSTPSSEPQDFETIYKTILGPSCAISGCHNASASGQLSMPDACSAYQALTIAGSCGESRVHAGDADSLIVNKLQSMTPRCGGPMPPTGPLPSSDVDAIRAWIVAGAKPPTCN